jgi:replicative DNA helicase
MTAALASNFIAEIEQEILGSLLMVSGVTTVLGVVRPEHFVEPLHRRIFENMLLGHDRYGSSSIAIVFKLFPEDEAAQWSKSLGRPLSAYLAALASNTVHGVAGFKKSIPNLLSQSARIGLAVEAENIAAAANDPGVDPSALIRNATRAFDDIASRLRGSNRGRTRHSLHEAATAALIDVETAMFRGDGLTGVTWGLSEVNRSTGGLQRGEMTVLGARPSMGKTAVGLSVAIKAAKKGHGVAFMSLEMGAKPLSLRAMTDIAFDWNVRVPYSDLITGKVDPKDLEAIRSANQDLDAMPLWIEEQSGMSISDIAVKLERIKDVAERSGHTIDLLVVDYLQLVAPSSRYQGNRTAEITEISAGLRNLCREAGVSLLALSQLSRQVETREDKRPMLSDLRESGAIEQDADTVIFLFREAYYLSKGKGKDADAEMERLDRLEQVENKLEFIIAKQRNGPVRTVDLFIDIASSAVRSAARI